jgi:RHS repeat-associated protein
MIGDGTVDSSDQIRVSQNYNTGGYAVATTQTRSANAANEITGMGPGSTWVTPIYDAAGNMTTIPGSASSTQQLVASYDAWNRLVRLTDGTNTVAEYRYDGRRRRIVKSTYTGGMLDETRHIYFTHTWQSIEERVATSATAERTYVWGIRYVDELISRDRQTVGGVERLYACVDGNFRITSLSDLSGTVVERYNYEPYGRRMILSSLWSPITASSYDWNVGHQGLFHNTTTNLIENRHRDIQPSLGLFGQRDPLAYVNGMNLYEYEKSMSLSRLDPFGLSVICCRGVRGDSIESQFQHCDMRPGPCAAGEDSYDVYKSSSATRTLDNGMPCSRATQADIDACEKRYPYSARPYGAIGTYVGNNCQASTLRTLSACCENTYWQPNWYAGSHTPCLKGHWFTFTVRARRQVFICDQEAPPNSNPILEPAMPEKTWKDYGQDYGPGGP